MRILLSGSTGFIGSHLLPKLVERGHEVTALHRYVTGRYVLGEIYETVFACLRDQKGISHAVKTADPEVCIHLAAISPVAYSFSHPQEVTMTNYLGLINLAEACRTQTTDFKQFISAGTCYDSKTRVYTLNGLKTYSELKIGDRVLSLNLASGLVELDEVSHIMIQNYKGDMIQFKGQRIDLMVTPNHKMVVRRTNGELIFEKAEETAKRSICGVPYGKWKGIDNHILSLNNRSFDTNVLFYLIGLFIGDGYVSETTRIHEVKTGLTRKEYLSKAKDLETGRFKKLEDSPTTKDYVSDRVYLCFPEEDKSLFDVKECLSMLGLEHSRHGTQIYVKTSSKLKDLIPILRECGSGAHNKQIPPWVLNYAPEYLEYLLKGLMDSDGHRGRVYTTVSKKLCEQLLELGVKLNMGVSIIHRHKSSQLEGRTIEGWAYDVYFNSVESNIHRHQSQTIPYEGIIWCPTIKKNHNLLVERNGKTCFSGNSEEYGTQIHFPIREDAVLKPNSPYAVSKAASTMYLEYMSDAYGFPMTVCRPFNTYGRVKNRHFVTERILTQMLEGVKELRLGDPDPVRDMMFREDHVRAYLTVLGNADAVGEKINFCTGEGYSIAELVSLCAELTDWKGEIVWNTIPKRPLDIDVLIGDNTKAKGLGWTPAYSLFEGLQETIKGILSEH